MFLVFLISEKRTFRVSSFEIISFSTDSFSGFRSVSEVTIERNDTVSRFSCFLREKKRVFVFRASKLFRFRLTVFRGSEVRMGLQTGGMTHFPVFRVSSGRKKDFSSFELRNYFVFD